MRRALHRCLSPSTYVIAMMLCVMTRMAFAAEIAVVLSDSGGAYEEVADEIRRQLEPAVKVSVHNTAGVDGLSGEKPQYLVAVGAKAALAVANSPLRIPLLVTLVPRTAYERLAVERKRDGQTGSMSAVLLDQPFSRQLDLIRLAMPGAKRIGLLMGPETQPRYQAMQSTALERQLRLNALQVERESEIFPALQKLLHESDLILAMPEPSIFNAGTIQMILLSTYRQRLPLVGFSAAYTRAGAVMSLFSTPQQIGRQAADMLRAAMAGGRLPPPQPPNDYLVSINPHVARSLGITLESEQQLLQRLKSLE